MGYVVIREFTDKEDKQKYKVGDRYPHRGFAKKERLEELSSKKNQRGEVLIKFKESEETEKEVEEDKPVREERPRRSRK
jgi:hypothetical protein